MRLKRLFEARYAGRSPDTIVILADDEAEARRLVPDTRHLQAVIACPGYVSAVGASRVLSSVISRQSAW